MTRGRDAVSLRAATRRSIVIGTAGHIDHGKSALVRALTGIDPDRLKEERERGITIDLGFAHCDIDGLDVAFVDVPGHERFIRNMLAGATGIDAVMLVVSAEESIKPQTREHFAICRLLGVESGLVALTKADLVDEDALELARLEIAELVAGTFLEGHPVLSVSSLTGVGLGELRRAMRGIADGARSRDEGGPVRLPIDRVFTVRGFGTVVTGTLVSGTMATGGELMLTPQGRTVKIRGLQVHGSDRRSAVAGERVAVNLGGVEASAVARGDSLVTPGSLAPSRVLDAIVTTLGDARPLGHDAPIRFHQGTSEILGRLSVAHVVDSARREEVAPGQSAYVRVRLSGPAVVTRGDRFILRRDSPSETVAGGRVLDPAPERGRIRSDAALARWTALGDQPEGNSRDGGVMQFVRERGTAGHDFGRLVSRAGGDRRALEDWLSRAVDEHRVVAVGDVVMTVEAARALKDQVLEVLSAYHEREAQSEGMARGEIRARLSKRIKTAVVDWALACLEASRLVRVGERIALETHRVVSTADDRAAMARIESMCLDAGLAAPDASALKAAVTVGTGAFDRLVVSLLRDRVLVKISDLLFHEQTLARLRHDVSRLKASGQLELEVNQFKARFNVTRKYAIPLLEYLDRERITRRLGDRRVIL
jgi:selenocysteine-specific elongation factor